MKKLLSGVVIAALSMGLAGCGSSVPTTGTVAETTVTATTEASDESTAVEATAETTVENISDTTVAAADNAQETDVKADTGTDGVSDSKTDVGTDGGAGEAETGDAGSDADAEETTMSVEEANEIAEYQKKLLEAFSSSIKTVDSIAPFEAEDMDGNIVTDGIFKDADVTLVHVWATYCPPCLKEMENLGKMADSLPENAQVLGIVADVTDSDMSKKEEAVGILKDNNISFTNVVMSKSFDDLRESIIGVPTTFVVDSDGKIVGAPVIGSDVLEYKRRAKDYLQSIGK